MSNNDFIKIAKALIIKRFNEDSEFIKIGKDNVFVVWIAKVLENNKALFGLDIEGNNFYYEVTYNGAVDEYYIDIYDKLLNIKHSGSIVDSLILEE